ncbi:MAG: response regulator [Gemmatimonadaceae bacterium]|nr:response regulator [Gemmatimonadaceae bacterium]
MQTNPVQRVDPRKLRFRYVDTRRWVLIGTAIGTAAYLVLALVNYAAGGKAGEHDPRVLLAAAAVSAVGSLVTARGRVFVGGMIALLAFWCEVHWSLATAQSFPVPSLLAGSAVLVAAALLLRAPDSMVLAAFTVASTWLAVLLSPAVRREGISAHVLYWLTVHTVITLAVWALVSLGFAIVDRAFLELLRKERELAETIDRAPDGILVLDAQDQVQVANPAAERLLGMSRAQCVGHTIAEVLAAAGNGSAHGERLEPLLHDTGERPRAWSLLRADGHQAELEVTWRAMEEGRRQLVLRDVSERTAGEAARRQMEVQLAHAQRLEAVGQLAGGIAHDFNNILTIVGASAEVLRNELRDDANAPLLDEILAAQERGATLTRQLLAFARRDVVQPRVFDVSSQVLTLRSLLQRVAGEQLRLSFDVEPDCRIRADVGQVEQALVNLVSNARDATPAGGTCAISVVRMTNDDGSEWVRLRVRDDGSGMDEATRLRVFEPFFTTKPRGRGTGLGLAAVHGMVAQGGGRADIESAVGHGTTVLLEFPFAQGALTEPVTIAPTVPQGGGATILVAEDDDGTRATVARMLGRLGYRVILAPDGLQALRQLELHGADVHLLLTDVMMPGLGGPALAARARAERPSLPVLFMSGYPEEALEAVPGFNLETDFLSKPFAASRLAASVAHKLGGATPDATPVAAPV